MSRFEALFRSIWSVLVVVLLMVAAAMVLVIGAIFERKSRKSRLKQGKLTRSGLWVKRYWARFIMRSHRIHLRIHGPFSETVKSLTGVIFVSNHQSALDIPILMEVAAENACFIAKKELKAIPLFGLAADLVGTVFIDRSRGIKNDSLGQVYERLKDGFCFNIFPEGTRSEDGNLKAFKRGAAVMAIEAQTSIVPIAICGSRDCNPKGAWFLRPGLIDVYVGEPLSAHGLTYDDRQAFMAEVSRIISKQLEKLQESRDNKAS